MGSEINPNNFSDKNVDVVVGKYKRAAGFLWTILHAQGCKLPVGKCPIKGCSDAKQLLSHILSCSACHGGVCPTGYQGCHQARKLIGHYRECQKQKRTQRNKEQKSHCLLCTLLSRHKPIRIVFDHTEACLPCQDKTSMMNQHKGTELSVSPLTINRRVSSQSMPPPPPRPRGTSQCHGSPMSTCTPSRKVVRIRSGSLDGRKVHANSNRCDIDPTLESGLKHPSGRNKELGSNKPLTSSKMMHSCRRRSMSCSSMPSGLCDTILEETTTDNV